MKKNDKILTGLFIAALVVVILLYLARKKAASVMPENPENQGQEVIQFGSTPKPANSGSNSFSNAWNYLFGSSESGPSVTIPSYQSVTTGNSNNSKFNALPSVGRETVLAMGSKNREVWEMQQLYNARIATPEGKAKLVVDGIFGNNTRAAVLYTTNGKKDSMTLTQWNTITGMLPNVRKSLFK